MEKMRFGELTLCKMSVEEFSETFGTDWIACYGEDVQEIAWFEKYDKNGEIVAMSMETMLICANNVFAYTSRGVRCEGNFAYCLEVINWLETVM